MKNLSTIIQNVTGEFQPSKEKIELPENASSLCLSSNYGVEQLIIMKDLEHTIRIYNLRLMYLLEALQKDTELNSPLAPYSFEDHERFMIHRERASIFRYLEAVKPDARLKNQTAPETFPDIHLISDQLERKINRLPNL